MIQFFQSIIGGITFLWDIINNFIKIIGTFLGFVFNVLTGTSAQAAYIWDLLPWQVIPVAGVLIGLVITGRMLGLISWIKHMLPFQ